MSSGKKTEIVNTQERAVSTDINRLQAFAAADDAELLRYMLDVTTNDDLTTGNITEYAAVESPLRAEIMNGLLVTARIGGLDLFVSPGVLHAIAPDSDADASNYKYVRDPGINSLNTLLVTANSSGSTRIDVIEVQVDYRISESDNRDVFNPSTGLFAATSLSKARQGKLNYRVRAGTPGSGFPGTASGWLPLAVASVPTGTTTNDTVTFWDVRPLLSDRKNLMAVSEDYPIVDQVSFTANGTSTSCVMNGKVQATAGSRTLGGILRRGTPGTDADSVDICDAANKEGSFSGFVDAVPFYLYLLTPFGLPRWARYTDVAFGSRVPRSPRGILVTSTVAPKHLTGAPSAVINLPASTGLGSNTASGVCIASLVPMNLGGLKIRSVADGKVIWLGGDVLGLAFTTSGLNSGTTDVDFTMTAGTTHPANAKAVYVSFNLLISIADGDAYSINDSAVQTLLNGGTDIASAQSTASAAVYNKSGGPLSPRLSTETLRVPVPVEYPNGSPTTWTMRWHWGTFLQLAQTPAPSSANMQIHGWEI